MDRTESIGETCVVQAAEAVLGVNIAAGDAYLVLVEKPNVPAFARITKIAMSANTDDLQALAQLGDRFSAEARAHNVVAVAFAEPAKYQNWSYRTAFSRAAPQVAASLALRASGVEVLVVPQITAATALDARGRLDEAMTERFRSSGTAVVHWKERVPALAVALFAAKARWP